MVEITIIIQTLHLQPVGLLRKGGTKTKERSEFETAASILRACGKGAKPIDIIYHCKLDPLTLEKYLFALMELGLLKAERKSQASYRTSDDGLQFLQTYHRLKWLLHGKTFDFLLTRLIGRLKRQI